MQGSADKALGCPFSMPDTYDLATTAWHFWICWRMRDGISFLPMTLTVDIPDDLAAELGVGFQNLGRAALEALAAEAYSKEVLSLEQIRRMLGLGSLWEAQAMLSRHAVWPDQSAEEILADARRSFEFRQAIA